MALKKKKGVGRKAFKGDPLRIFGQAMREKLSDVYAVVHAYSRGHETLEIEKKGKFLWIFPDNTRVYWFERAASSDNGLLVTYESTLSPAERKTLDKLLRKVARSKRIRLLNKGFFGPGMLPDG